MGPIVQRIPEIPNMELGEGPHWDIETQSLYLVDITSKSIHKYNPSTGQHSKATFDKLVSFIIPVQGKRDQFVVALERDICIVTWDGRSEKVSKIEKIVETDPDKTTNRVNDGKCDASGRLWAGSLGVDPETGKYTDDEGTLFSLTKGKLATHVTKIGISNGLAWNKENTKLYYIDSIKGTVDQFDADITNGLLTNRSPIFTFAKHNIEGAPDGMTIDVDGNLWVAGFNTHGVFKIDPRKPETLLQKVDFPAKQITSVAWGGIDLDTLFVTSARIVIEGEVLLPPDHGAIYRVTGLGTKGLPGFNYVL